MPVTLSPGPVHGWDGWWIRRPPLELGLVPQVGGRLMSMRWRGHELSWETIVSGDAALTQDLRISLDATRPADD